VGIETTEVIQCRWRNTGEQAPPHREGHHRAGPNAVVLLHPSRLPAAWENTESEATQRTEASPLPPLDASLACAGTANLPLSTPLLVCRDLQTHHTAPHSELVSRIVVKVARRGAPREPYQATRPPSWFEIIMFLPTKLLPSS
jgi:hypothetical protein